MGMQGDVLLREAVAAPAPTGAQHATIPWPLATISQCNPYLLRPGSPNKALLEPASLPLLCSACTAAGSAPSRPRTRLCQPPPHQAAGTSGDQPSLKEQGTRESLGVALLESGGCWLLEKTRHQNAGLG